MKKIILLLLIFALGFGTVMADNRPIDVYTADDGMKIVSYAENWNQDKLKQIYEELKRNTHGEEWSYLESVNLYPGPSLNGKEDGLYNYTLRRTSLFSGEKLSLERGSRIDLYNMDVKNTVSEAARVLSHEYGHHFTIYYLAKNDPEFFSEWEKSGFYSARQGSAYGKMSNEQGTEHRWNIAEIAAEDYVQLYGSPTGKTAIKVNDIKERLDNKTLDRQMWFSSAAYNIIPQENMDIPLALTDDNISLYWEEVSGIKADVEYYSKPELKIGKIEDLGNEYSMYELAWTKSTNGKGEEALSYTVVAFGDEMIDFVPIKTVFRGEKRSAIIGSVLDKDGRNLRYYTDYFVSNGFSRVKIIVTGSKGEAVASSLYTLDLSQGKIAAENGIERQSYYVPGELSDRESRITSFIIDMTEELIRRIFSLVERLLSYNINFESGGLL
ncbi:hypothetical protein [Alkalibacter saccharofermentans]|uniref:Uncharacterized protein n=1 Tax=Alkalibacter saccharofermentans DSM 14828 TaxID=1120975 RepID=A0A1M4YYP8_9FIRM|nr:hypothetical protein [Alkalibacter saccharofermentans]SHF10622.1 hypothetical protein SAMN02746064_01903 [Alkalibacter saccharofermentans DSM 14828]